MEERIFAVCLALLGGVPARPARTRAVGVGGDFDETEQEGGEVVAALASFGQLGDLGDELLTGGVGVLSEVGAGGDGACDLGPRVTELLDVGQDGLDEKGQC